MWTVLSVGIMIVLVNWLHTDTHRTIPQRQSYSKTGNVPDVHKRRVQAQKRPAPRTYANLSPKRTITEPIMGISDENNVKDKESLLYKIDVANEEKTAISGVSSQFTLSITMIS